MKTRVYSDSHKQQTMHVNPIQEYRKRTDVAFIIIFSIIFWIWMSITIQALVFPPIAHIRSEPGIVQNAYLLFDVTKIELSLDSSFIWQFPFCTSLATVVAMVYMFLLFQPKIGHVIIFVATFILFFSIFGSFTGVIMLFRGSHVGIIIMLFLFLLVYLVYQLVVLYCFGDIGINIIFEIVGDSCRALLFYPSSLLFVCFMSVLIVLIFSLSLHVLKSIPTYNMYQSHIITYYAIELFGVYIVIAFITNFTKLVIAGFVIDRFWTKDKNLEKCYFIRKNIDRTLRYHVGTISFASIPLLTNICGIFQALCCENDYDGIPKKDHIFIRFVSQTSLIINMTDFALIQTAIYGSHCTSSIKTAVDFVSQHSKFNLTVTEISNVIVMIGVVLTILPFEVEKLYYAMYSIPVPFMIIMTTAFRALLVNKMIMDNTSGALKSLIVNVQEPSMPPMYYV